MADVEINGVDPSTYNIVPRSVDDLLGTPNRPQNSIILPVRAGYRVGLRRVASKPFTVGFRLSATSLADASSNLDAFYDLLMKVQPSTMVLAWSTTRRLSVECLGVDVTPLGPAFGVLQYEIVARFDAPDPPFWEATTEHAVTGIGSTGVPLPQGNAPVWPRIRITDASNPKLTLRNSTGSEVATLTLTGSVSSSEYFAIDMDLGTIYTNESGEFSTGDSAISALSSGDFFDIKPEYSNHATSSWATLEVSTGTAEVFYHKAWW